MKTHLIRASVIGGLLLLPASLSLASSSAKTSAPALLAYNGGGYYVCYRSRHAVVTRSGHRVLVYRGCFRTRSPCNYHHSYHFGRYSSYVQASGALNRCMASTPRHVD